MKRKPTSPGEILQEEFLKPLGWSHTMLASRLGCDKSLIREIIQARAPITPEIAASLSKLFDVTPDFWLNAQRATDSFFP